METPVLERIEQFFSKFQSLKYKKGEIISRADDPIFGIYFLRSGLVRQYLISPQGHELTIRLFKKDSFFPLLLAMSDLPNRYYLQAVTDIEVYRAPTDKVMDFIKDEPGMAFLFVGRLSNSFYEIITRFENFMTEQAYGRVVSLFGYLGRYIGKKEGNKIIIDLPLTHEDIASWAGINRETASRQIEKLVKRGLISHQKHLFTLEDYEKLEEENI